VHCLGEPQLLQGGHVELELYSTRSGQVQARRVVRAGQEVVFDTGRVPFGCCAFRASAVDRHGERFPAEVIQDRLPGEFPWLGSSEGLGRGVPPPWTPLRTGTEAAGARVSCWGREYAFGGCSFLAAATSGSADLLAAPVGLVARVDGRAVQWRRARLRVQRPGRDRVVLASSWGSEAGLSVSARTEVDFDGMVRVDWELAADRAVRVDRLALEVPIAPERARYFYHFPGQWGSARNVGALPAEDLSLSFRPFVWLGDEERGLAWFAESDRGWSVREPHAAVEIHHRGRAMVLRLNLVTLPARLVPGEAPGRAFTGHGEERRPAVPGGLVAERLRYTFGLQATPVKPVTRDAWEQRIYCIGQQTEGFRPRFRVSSRLLDRLVAAGVRAVVLFEHWADAEGYVRTPLTRQVRRVVEACHRRGLQVLLYHSFLISDLAAEWPAVGKDCVVVPRAGYPVFHYQPQPEQSAWRVCLASLYQDLLVDGMARTMDELGTDGVYLDGTEYPFACLNTEHGCGTPGAGGSLAPSYPIFAVRSAMRRIHEVVRTRRPEGLVNVHNSTCMTIPTLGWASSYWDGEQFQGVRRGADVSALLPMDAFRAEFTGRPWGVPAEFLLAGEAYTYEQAWAFCLLHDVPVRPHAPGPDLDLIASIWRVMDAFGRKDAEWLPYWENRACARTSARDSYVSLYRHPRNGVLAVVANLGKEPARIRLWLNAGRLGLPAGSGVTDALAGNTVPGSPGGIDLRMKSLDWKLLWLKG
jgi:hypothetical protein